MRSVGLDFFQSEGESKKDREWGTDGEWTSVPRAGRCIERDRVRQSPLLWSPRWCASVWHPTRQTYLYACLGRAQRRVRTQSLSFLAKPSKHCSNGVSKMNGGRKLLCVLVSVHIHPPIHPSSTRPSIIHPLIHHPAIHSSSIHTPIPLSICPFIIHSFNHPFIHSSFYSFIQSSIPYPFIHPFPPSICPPIIHPFIHLFLCPFIHHLFIQFYEWKSIWLFRCSRCKEKPQYVCELVRNLVLRRPRPPRLYQTSISPLSVRTSMMVWPRKSSDSRLNFCFTRDLMSSSSSQTRTLMRSEELWHSLKKTNHTLSVPRHRA